MYEELVKMLRKHYVEHCPLDRAYGICGCLLANEAADAIEELKERLGWKEHFKILAEQDFNPRWIPVKEKLPDDRRDVQITVFWHDAWRTMYGYYDGAYWHLYAPMHTEVADVYVIGWMEKPTPMPLPQPSKEEA